MSFLLRTSTLFLLAVAIAFAQQGTATISGTVTDPQDAAIGGATVQIRNTATGAEFRSMTNDAGFYTAPGVAVGLVVEAPVDPLEGVLALDQRVAELVEDHLGERVVGVERGVVTDDQRAGALARAGRRVAGVRVRRPDDPQADPGGAVDPDLRERVDVTVLDGPGHAPDYQISDP